MSTYTDLHTRRRENVTILRNPGNQDDGITPQRVIFANPENIYEGTFNGKINAVGVSFTSVDLSDVTIHNGTIEDATIKSGNQTISMTALTANVSEISGELTSVRIDVQAISNKIDSFTGLSDLTGEGGGIATLSSNLISIIDSTSAELSNQFTAQINSISSSLSTAISNETDQRAQKVNELSNSIDKLSGKLTAESTERNAVDDGIVKQLSIVSTDLSIGLKTERDRIDSTNDQLASHIERSDKHFNDVLSALYRDRHYKIVKSLTQNPYNVEDFAINVIEDYASNVKIMNGGVCIGYGYIVEDEDTKLSVLNVKLCHNDQNLVNVIPQNFTKSLPANVPVLVGQQYFYNITWIPGDNAITLDKTASNLYKIVDTTDDIVAYIKNAQFADASLTAGTITFQSSSPFYKSFKNGIIFTEDTSIYWDDDNANCIEFKLPNEFIFHANAKEIKYTPIKYLSGDAIVSGIVSNTGISKSSDNTIQSIDTIQSIEFNDFSIAGYDVPSTVKIEKTEDGLSASVGQTVDNASIIISCDDMIEGNKCHASVSTVGQMYKYKFYSQTDNKFTNFIQPKLYNSTAIDDSEFDELTVWFKNPSTNIDVPFECIKSNIDSEHNKVYYKSRDNDSGVDVTVIKNQLDPVGSTWTITLVKPDDINNLTISSTYEVRKLEYEPGDKHVVVVASLEIDFNNEMSKITGDYSINARVDGEVITAGDQYVKLNVDNIDIDDVSLNIKLPQKNSMDYAISREFIILAKIKGGEGQQFKLNLVDDANSNNKLYYSNGKECNVKIKAGNWNALRVSEIDNDVFLVEDLDNTLVRDNISSLFNNLSLSVESLTGSDDALSEQLTAAQLSISDIAQLSIPDIWKNIRGGLNYAGTLTISANDFDLSNAILTQTILKQTTSIDGNEDQSAQNNNGSAQTTSDDSAQTRIRTGFFYIVHGKDPNAHYESGNLTVENGDWLIVKENTILSDLNNDSFDVLDADDSGNFKLSGSNSISGDNIFKGTVGFNCDSISAKCPISIIGNTAISGTTILCGQTDIYEGGLCVHDHGISIDASSLFSGDLSCASSICAYGGTIEISPKDGESKTGIKIDKNDGVSVSSGKISLSSNNTITVDASLSCSKQIQANGSLSTPSLTATTANITSIKDLSSLDASSGSATISSISATSLSVSSASAICYSKDNHLCSISSLSDEIYGNVKTLSDEYHNTLSAVDKEQNSSISSDNLIVTNAGKLDNNNAKPSRYYMTFLSGTIVLKKMA